MKAQAIQEREVELRALDTIVRDGETIAPESLFTTSLAEAEFLLKRGAAERPEDADARLKAIANGAFQDPYYR